MIREKILPKLLLLNTRLVVGTYTAMTLPLYAALQRPWAVKRVAKAKRTTAHRSADGSYTFWRRHGPPVSHPNGYHTCDSFKEVLQVMRVKEDQNRVRLSQRPVISEKIKVDDKGQTVTQDGKVVKEIQLASEYKWLTLGQVFEKVDNLARGLASVGGVVPREKVIIFADTRLEWFLSALALFELDTVLVTLFSNLGQDGLVHGMKQTGAKHVITSVDLLPRMATFIESTPNIEKIYYICHEFQKGQIKPADLPKFPPHVQVIPLDEVEEAGKTAPPLNVPLPKVDDVALIMYTSGTTGTPKAVILQNRQLNGALKALTSNVNDLADEAYRHVYASFLPLAHIMGLTFELFLFTGGVRIGYSSPTTLTDTSPAHPPGQLGDLKLLQPTTLITVPLILDRIVKEIYLKISTRSALLPPIVTYLLDYKIRWTKRGFDTPIINRLVCGRVREQFGGKLEFVISGGAPLNPRTEELIRAALNVKLMQGYGLTETTGGIVGMMRQDIDSGKAGYPLDGVSVRLKSWDEGGYTVDDRPNPRGEVLISGDSVGVGYYKLEEETKEAFSVDPSDGTRWFHTGDIGEIYPNGSLKIVDRKKDLAKLPNGEYISLGKIESALKTASLVENACICVSEKLNDIVALVTPNEKMLRVLAAELGKKNLTREQLCADPQVQKAVNKAVTKICASAGLHRRETPVRVHLCAEEWLPDNELLTAAFKLKRRNVLQFYQKEVDALFNQLAASR